MNVEIVNEICESVKNACNSPQNKFGYGIWTNHIEKVVEYGIKLSVIFGADEEIVVISALLHDLAGILDYTLHDEHHIYGAELAEKILSNYNFPIEKIEKVKLCILNHRGSRKNDLKSNEEKCIASADAMAHITEIHSLFYYVYNEAQLNIEEGREWIVSKIERSWNKLDVQARELIEEEYNAIKVLFGR